MESISPHDNLVVLNEYESSTQAYLDKGLLEANGIMCVINNEIFSNIYPITFNSIGALKLLVLKREEQLARKILAENSSSSILED